MVVISTKCMFRIMFHLRLIALSVVYIRIINNTCNASENFAFRRRAMKIHVYKDCYRALVPYRPNLYMYVYLLHFDFMVFNL